MSSAKDNANGGLLPNGLTAEMVEGIKEILSQVNVSAICNELGFKPYRVYQVLNGKSDKIELLNQVLEKAKIEIETKRATLAGIREKVISE